MPPPSEHLFLSQWGEPPTPGYLSRVVREYIEESGVKKQGSCHLFRHTVATLMLENGADIRHIQELLGHADLKATQLYTHVSIKRLKAVHTATHPASRDAIKPVAKAQGENAVPTEAELEAELEAALAAERQAEAAIG